jgi:peptide/nickel transport system substrate-binding protein
VRARPLALVVLLAAVLAAGCGQGGGEATSGGEPAPADGGLTAPVEVDEGSADPLAGGFAADGPITRGGVLRLALARDPACWTGVADDPASATVFAFAARGLYGYAEPSRPTTGRLPVPVLAADMPLVSDDGRTYTVRLRSDLRFPDGAPVTADAVRATVELLLDPTAQCAGRGPLAAGAFAGLVGRDAFVEGRADGRDPGDPALAGVRVLDALTISFELEAPDGAFPLELAAPWAFLRPPGTDPVALEPPAFVGPYRFAERAEGAPVRLEREPSWEANVAAGVPAPPGEDNVDGAEIAVGVPAAEQVAGLVAGDLDLSLDPDVPSGETAERLRGLEELEGRLFATPDLALDYGVLRVDVPPFDDPVLRQAVNRALRRDRLAAIVGGPLGARGWSALLPSSLLAGEASDPYPRDPALAREQIAAAGGAPGPLVLAHPDEPRARAVAVEVRRQLRTVGLRVRLRAVEPGLYEGFLRSPDAPFHLAVAASTPLVPDAAAILAPLLTCEAPRNYGRWCGKGFDAALGDAVALPVGPERSQRLARLATEVAVASAPWWTISQRRHLSLVGPRVANYRWAPIVGPDLGRVVLRGG